MMPTLSNGSELSVWEDTENQSPDAVLFTITETDGDVLGPGTVHVDYPFGWVDVASIDVFDGFFTVTTFTNDGRTEIFTTVETIVFDNEGRHIRTLSDQAAYLSTEIISVAAESPDDITVTWTGRQRIFWRRKHAVRPASDHSGRRRAAAGHFRQLMLRLSPISASRSRRGNRSTTSSSARRMPITTF